MGRKHKHSSKRPHNDEGAAPAKQHAPDPWVACLALHPHGDFVAVAAYDTVRISKHKYVSQRLHKHALLFRSDSSNGDSKLVKTCCQIAELPNCKAAPICNNNQHQLGQLHLTTVESYSCRLATTNWSKSGRLAPGNCFTQRELHQLPFTHSP